MHIILFQLSSSINVNQLIITVMMTLLADFCAVGYHAVHAQITLAYIVYAISYLHNRFNLGELVNSAITILNLSNIFSTTVIF